MAKLKPELVVGNMASEPEQPADPTDIFNDIAALRKNSKLTVTKHTVMATLIVDRPSKDEHFRINPDPNYMLEAHIYESREGKDRITYYVTAPMAEHEKLSLRLKPALIVVLKTWPDRVTKIWPMPINIGGKDNNRLESIRQAFELAKSQWCQMVWSDEEGAYLISTAEGTLPEPSFPTKPFAELLKVAFKGKIIDGEDHPVLRRLRGME